MILVEGYVNNLRASMKERFYRGRERGSGLSLVQGWSPVSLGWPVHMVAACYWHYCRMLFPLFFSVMWWVVSVQQKAIRTRRRGRMRKRRTKMKFPKRRKRKDKCSEYFCCLCVVCAMLP